MSIHSVRTVMAIENANRNEQEAQSIDVAEDSRELDWKSKSFMGSMFMGELDMELAYPYPEQSAEDKAEGDELLARIDAWANDAIDGDQIDRDEEIPAHVFKGLADLGLFGIKIPKKYGGLGMSQTNYMRILGHFCRYHCGSVGATLSAHQSIGIPQPLKLFGTEEQKKKFLPRIARGEISAFGLTEPQVGSDPANLATHAELNEAGTHWVLNGEKLWCTNGVIADLFVVMARTPDKVIKGKPRKQITAFIVEGKWDGVDVLHRSKFMGIRAIENGVIRFTDVQVPVDHVIAGEGRGLKLALTTLNDGRLGIPAICAETTKGLVEFSARWAKTRHQWGKHIGEHEAGADKLARMAAGAYAMETLAFFGGALSDAGGRDLRMEAATAKMFNSELISELGDLGLQFRGGRGYEQEASLKRRGEHAEPIERGVRDARINRIVEGTTDIMHLFLAREALDPHLKVAAPLFGRASAGVKFKTLLACAAKYATWYPKLWLGGLFRWFGDFDGRLRGHLRWVDARTRKLARTLFHQMILQGPKLEMRQLILARVVDIGAELAVMALVASRVQTELKNGDTTNVGRGLYWLKSRRVVVDRMFEDISSNCDADARKLAAELMLSAEALEDLPKPDLSPLPREYGSDLTSGRQTVRASQMRQQDDAAAK
ncbi:MAG: DNA polymerase II [Proteobacteria bacterium]|nr:DNA polymerase II [Pseudomonadota bacterium]MCP4916412.1 DNA polymerase II [Pseudomonadota bacterium]